jgi:hypothetical protein
LKIENGEIEKIRKKVFRGILNKMEIITESKLEMVKKHFITEISNELMM